MALTIVIASDFYPPFIGGAERQAQLLSRELVARGHRVAVATVWHAGLVEQEADQGVAVHRIRGLATMVPWFSKDAGRRFHPPFPEPGIVAGLRRLIVALRPDVVHANGWIAYSCAAALLGATVPLVISARDYGYSCPLRNMVRSGAPCDGPAPLKCLACSAQAYGWPKAGAAALGVFGARGLLVHKTAAVHSVSTFVEAIVRRDLLGPGEDDVASGRTYVIPSFLEEGIGAPGPDDAIYIDQLPALPFMLFVGALKPDKGIGQLLAAYRRMSSPPPLVLIGSTWPETPVSFPDGVTVLRNVPHSAVMAAWERCLFGVAPSVWPEPLAGVIREAMVKGKAVVATHVGGNSDMVVDGETGLLVTPSDVPALAAAMQRLADDAALRERLGAAGLERSALFQAQNVVGRFEQAYFQAVGHR